MRERTRRKRGPTMSNDLYEKLVTINKMLTNFLSDWEAELPFDMAINILQAKTRLIKVQSDVYNLEQKTNEEA